jgi:hypothetical protein
MSEKIKLVRNDTRPVIVVAITDKRTGEPMDLSSATVLFKFRAVGSDTLKATISCTLLPGYEDEDGTVVETAPYNALGRGGRLYIPWTPTALDTAGEFEGELEATFGDGGIQTIYDTMQFTVREDFA